MYVQIVYGESFNIKNITELTEVSNVPCPMYSIPIHTYLQAIVYGITE
jgi:hypothetical protein